MKTSLRLALALAGLLCSAGSTQACCLWPFGGWWGAGYGGYPAPMYAGYGYGYAPPAYAPVYSVSYGGTGCCVPSCCCDPCCGTCTTGSCGAGTSGSESLKPTTDPNFQRKRDTDYDARDNDTETDPLDQPAPNRRRTNDTMDDDFGAETGKGNNAAEPPLFGTEGDQINNKPPMPDVNNLPPADDAAGQEGTDGKTFLDEDKAAAPQASRPGRTLTAERSSRLDEVVQPKRLASRSVSTSRETTRFAGSATKGNATVRWISVPLPEGHERL